MIASSLNVVNEFKNDISKEMPRFQGRSKNFVSIPFRLKKKTDILVE